MPQNISILVANYLAIDRYVRLQVLHFKENSTIYQFSLPLATWTEHFGGAYLSKARAISHINVDQV